MNQKEIAARSAAGLVKDGQVVGLGTGSTAAFAIAEIARRIKDEGLDITGIPTSIATEQMARSLDIPLSTVDEHPEIDIDIDGADQVDALFQVIKGGGGAHTREKIVAKHSRVFAVIVDESKMSNVLNIPVPVEAEPDLWKSVAKELKALGANPGLRIVSGAPFITDNKNYVIDADFGTLENPGALEKDINS
ncbi:ribose 5-phosphate isomerase A, partial [archaeon]|nr:ribose 5-phosphate isomerase A [archaeon]